MLQETDDCRPVNGVRLHLRVHLAGERHSANDGEMIAGELAPQERCLPTRGIGSDHTGQEVKARLVYPDDGPPLITRFFWSMGQRSVCHRSIAASSRWVARTTGFCGLWLSARKSLATCPR